MIVTVKADRGAHQERPGHVAVDIETEFLVEDLVRPTEDLVEGALVLEKAGLDALMTAAKKAPNKRRLRVRINEADKDPALSEAVLEILQGLRGKARPDVRLEARRVDLRASILLARQVHHVPEPARRL